MCVTKFYSVLLYHTKYGRFITYHDTTNLCVNMNPEDVRLILVKEMLDQFPKLRKWVKAYLTVYG